MDLYDNLAFTSSTDPNNADNQIETWSVHTSYRQLYFDSIWFNYRGYEAHQKIDNFNKFYHQGYNTATLSPLTQIKIRVYWNVTVVDRQFTLPYENFTKIRVRKQTGESGRWTSSFTGTKPTANVIPLDTLSISVKLSVTGRTQSFDHYGTYLGSSEIITLPYALCSGLTLENEIVVGTLKYHSSIVKNYLINIELMDNTEISGQVNCHKLSFEINWNGITYASVDDRHTKVICALMCSYNMSYHNCI